MSLALHTELTFAHAQLPSVSVLFILRSEVETSLAPLACVQLLLELLSGSQPPLYGFICNPRALVSHQVSWKQGFSGLDSTDARGHVMTSN